MHHLVMSDNKYKHMFVFLSCLLVHLAPGILERYGAVEYEVVGGGFLVDVEVSDTAELQVVEWLGVGQVALYVAFGEYLQ